MNLIISSDERFVRMPDGIVWSIGGQSRAYSLWAKYLEVFDQVKILARVQDVDGNVVSPDMQRADGEGVSAGILH